MPSALRPFGQSELRLRMHDHPPRDGSQPKGEPSSHREWLLCPERVGTVRAGGRADQVANSWSTSNAGAGDGTSAAAPRTNGGTPGPSCPCGASTRVPPGVTRPDPGQGRRHDPLTATTTITRPRPRHHQSPSPPVTITTRSPTTRITGSRPLLLDLPRLHTHLHHADAGPAGPLP